MIFGKKIDFWVKQHAKYMAPAVNVAEKSKKLNKSWKNMKSFIEATISKECICEKGGIWILHWFEECFAPKRGNGSLWIMAVEWDTVSTFNPKLV